MSWRILVLVMSAVLALAGATTVLAQNGYSLVAWTVDGGGSSMTGGEFALSSTIGQPDAGLMQGGSYALQGGFGSGAPSGQTTVEPDRFIFLPATANDAAAAHAETYERTPTAGEDAGEDAAEPITEAAVDETPRIWLPVMARR